MAGLAFHMLHAGPHSHSREHAFSFLNGRAWEGLTVFSRRSMLKASLAGLAGLTLPGLLRVRGEAVKNGEPIRGNKRVILLWMAGGPSHIDTWDVKPDMPSEIRGPFDTIPTKLPGVRICEYLPKSAAMLDKFTLIRSVDCRESNHQPNMGMQTANLEAEPRTNPKGDKYPAIASIVAKLRGANHPAMPPYVALNVKDKTHFAWGGYLGKAYDPFVGDNVSKIFQLARGLTMDRLRTRKTLSQQMDRLRSDLDLNGSMEAMDQFSQRAFEIVAGGGALEALYLWSESPQGDEGFVADDRSPARGLGRQVVGAWRGGCVLC